MANLPDNPRFALGMRDTLRILWPYVKRNFLNQVQGIWFIVTYLVVFQLLVLQLPIAYASMIGVGIFIVALGLMFFMEGLRLGLMPLGEEIGSVLPKNSRMPVILIFAFLLGAGATFAEPAIAVLKAAGSGVKAPAAPLLYSLLNDFSGQLVSSVGVGVGFAVLLGVLRFFYAWPLKYLAIPCVAVLLGYSFYFSQVPILNDVLGLAWDCGAVTTGPVTVPLVLALGIGVCRVVSSGSGSGGHSGFGIVTLASLFPILAVLTLALYHYSAEDYYGAQNYKGEVMVESAVETTTEEVVLEKTLSPITMQEFGAYLQNGDLPDGYEIDFRGGDAQLVDGKIQVADPDVVIKKPYQRDFTFWRRDMGQLHSARRSALRLALKRYARSFRCACSCTSFYACVAEQARPAERRRHRRDVRARRHGSLRPRHRARPDAARRPARQQRACRVRGDRALGPRPRGRTALRGQLGQVRGRRLRVLLGYGATLAEPALNALGDTVERITVGAFRKKLLMQSVALGVAFGIAAGVLKMAYNLPLFWMLAPPYMLVLVLTWFAPHSFVNFSWDSAGVTTGPITVPLVLAMGLGVGANIPGVSDGFGILALASVGPIMTVLTVGLYTQHSQRSIRTEETGEDSALETAEAIGS